MAQTTPYWKRLLIAGDVFLNVIANGEMDMTISARLGLHKDKTWWGKLGSDILDRIQKHHVEGAIVHDEERAEQVDSDLKKGA